MRTLSAMPAKRPSKKAKPAKLAASKRPGPRRATMTEAISSKSKPGDAMAVKRTVGTAAGDGARGDEAGLPAEKVKKAEDVFDLVRNCDGTPECWLLLGAGCSYPEVPLAPGFVEIIKRNYPRYFGNAAEPKGYAQCMHVLPLEFRRKIIRENIEKARIVEGYIAIAALVQAGLIHKVLTVNFDPLLLKACALVGRVPAVYDLAASLYATDDPAKFKPTLATPAIVHLHGQNEGIVLINDPEEAKEMSKRLGWLFDGAEKHVWIVAGYSGEQDPVFQRLAETAQFDAGLFWVRHDDQMPCPAAVEMIEQKEGAAVIFNQPCDSFFATLAKALGRYPPEVMSAPLDHIEGRLKTQLSDSCQKAIAETIQYIERARDAIENDAATTTLQVQSLAQAGEFDKTLKAFKKVEHPAGEPKLLAVVAGAAATVAQLTTVFTYAQGLGIEAEIADAVAQGGLEVITGDPDGILKLLDALPPCAALDRRRKLNLDNTPVTDAGLAHLKGLNGLQSLSLTGTPVTDAGLAHLKGLAELQMLDLTRTQVTDAGLAHLKGLDGLKSLSLNGTPVTDAGLAHLKGLAGLLMLLLSNTQVTDAGLAHLKGLAGLLMLWLSDTQVTDAGLAHLKGLAELLRLFLERTQVTEAGLAALKKALPKCEIEGP